MRIRCGIISRPYCWECFLTLCSFCSVCFLCTASRCGPAYMYMCRAGGTFPCVGACRVLYDSMFCGYICVLLHTQEQAQCVSPARISFSGMVGGWLRVASCKGRQPGHLGFMWTICLTAITAYVAYVVVQCGWFPYSLLHGRHALEQAMMVTSLYNSGGWHNGCACRCRP